MSAPQPPPGQPATNGRPDPWTPPNASQTPNAERYLLEADALRRRQLRSALLHGSRRTWREHRRIWPGVAAGIVVVAVILATFAVIRALDEQRTDQGLGGGGVFVTSDGTDATNQVLIARSGYRG